MTSLLEAFAFHGVPFDGEAALRIGNKLYTLAGVWTMTNKGVWASFERYCK